MEQTDQIKTILGDLGLLLALVYCAGRWYKERYFAQLKVPWEMIQREHAYFLFGGWFTLLTAASVAAPFFVAVASGGVWEWLYPLSALLVLALARKEELLRPKRWDLRAVFLLLFLWALLLLIPSGARESLHEWFGGRNRLDIVLMVLAAFVALWFTAYLTGQLHGKIAERRGWLPKVRVSDQARTRIVATTRTDVVRFVARLDQSRSIVLVGELPAARPATVANDEIVGIES